MARFDKGFISDLTTVRDNTILCVRIVRTWMQPMHSKSKVINMELIIMDEQGAKMHATVRISLVPMFKQQLNEGDAVVLQMYNVLISNGPFMALSSSPLKRFCNVKPKPWANLVNSELAFYVKAGPVLRFWMPWTRF
nr:replication protein A 70 kDa DNA-binding subunit B [Tanacetum cinerariifolium]GEY88749.1 replication protein A 70 kDa DNA-binding subunit B [Tanacetum cinerariifolium]